MVTLIVETLTFVVMIFYVIATWRMATASNESVREMKETREQEFSPYVVVYFYIPEKQTDIELVIKNVGRMPAKNVKFTFNPPLVTSEPEITNFVSNFIKNGIEFLPPNYEIKTFVDITFAYFDEKKKFPLTYEAIVSWTDVKGKRQMSAEWKLDLSPYYWRLFSSEKGIHELAASTEKINNSLEKIEHGLDTIKNILSDGLMWTKNSNMILQQKPSIDIWKLNVLQKLNSFKIFWQIDYKRKDWLVNLSFKSIENSISSIGWQLLQIFSLCPDNVSRELKNKVFEIAQKILDLSYRRFPSWEERNNFGNELLKKIEQLEVEIKNIELEGMEENEKDT